MARSSLYWIQCLRRYNVSIYQNSNGFACNDRFYIARSLIFLSFFGILLAVFWHPLPRNVDCPWISHSCKLLFISLSNLGATSSRTTRHMTSPFSPDHLCPTQSMSEDWVSRHQRIGRNYGAQNCDSGERMQFTTNTMIPNSSFRFSNPTCDGEVESTVFSSYFNLNFKIFRLKGSLTICNVVA